MDNWIAARLGPLLRGAADPLVIDLGYGATPITAVELADRLARVRADVRVLGLEIDPDRVAAAQPAADPPRLEFARGGFELAGRRPAIVRAANVLRQYSESDALEAWATMLANLAPDGVLVEGTCDELGRLGGWVLLDATGAQSLTLAARVETLERPAELAERLPKALIHRNVRGEPVHERTIRGVLAGVLAREPTALMQLGLMILVATPVARVAFSVIGFALEGDRLYVGLTLVVLALLLLGLFGVG